jgi:hypothetical protein
VANLSPDWREVYEERAAIREYEGNFPRDRAEMLALIEVERMMRQERMAMKGRAKC